jgi:mono/diheme cytochrome c family protein
MRSSLRVSVAIGSLAVAAAILFVATGCPGPQPKPAPAGGGTSTATGTDPAAGPPADPGYGAKPPFDPIRVNGPVFDGWTKPQFALVITGEQDGYIEPCGCAGKENQKGGLARRFTFIQQLREQGWPVALVDVGNQVRRYGKQQEVKFQSGLAGLKRIGYGAIAFGPDDLRLPAGVLLDGPFVAANVGLLGFDSGAVPNHLVVAAGETSIGVTAVIGAEAAAEVNNPDVSFAPAEEKLPAALEALQAADCKLLVLLCHGTPDEARELARKFPAFSVVVAAGGADEPPIEPETVEGTKTLLISPGHKGQYAITLGFYDTEPRVRYQRVPLDARYPDASEMVALMAEYQNQLQDLGLEGLEVRAASHPRSSDGPTAGEFVGAKVCGECHTKAFATWQKTKHAHATQTLVELKPARQFDPECLSCHVTGWNPQEYYPYETGYLGLDATPHLFGNSCENCHGPGAAHTAAERARPPKIAERDRLRAQIKLSRALAEENVCKKCHDLDNSPGFAGHFDEFWPKVEHKGKD